MAVAKRGGHFAFVALSAAALASVLALSFGLALPVQAQSSTNTITVNSAQDNTDDDEQCTLREAIDNANSDSDTSGGDCAGGGGEDRIVFDIPASEPGCTSEDVCTITLGSQLPTITDGDSLSIEGEENDITVSGNDAVRVLEVNTSAELAVGNLTVADGLADSGGGIENFGTLEVTNSTFSQNSAGNFGGGIENISDDGTLTVTNSTFSQNSAQGGGGIFNRGSTATLANTIVANSPSSENCSGNLPITDEGGNLDDGTTCAFTAASSKSNAEDGLDPDGLKDNGGPTRTIALLPASEAIDMGVEETCAAPPVDDLDQRGVSRPQDGDGDGTATCDIGAFESRPSSFSVSDASATEGDSGTTNATFTVTRTLGDGPSSSSVSYATSDGTATAPEDYASSSGTLAFASGETSKTVEVEIKGDTLDEENETFTLDLSSPSAGAMITDGTGTGTITDDDLPPDTTKPTITDLTPPPGSTSNKNGRDIEATVKDDRSALQKEDIRLFLDGQERSRFTYDPQSGRLVFDKAGRLGPRKHSVRIEATDEAGNTAREKWTFRIR